MKHKILLILAFLVTMSSLALGIETELVVGKVTQMDGEEKIVDGTTASPGNTLEYIFKITNTQNNTKYNLRPSIPVPNNMTLIPSTIEPKNFMVSVDGVNYVNYPVLDENGAPVNESAYKKIQWTIDELKENDETQVKLRTRIDS